MAVLGLHREVVRRGQEMRRVDKPREDIIDGCSINHSVQKEEEKEDAVNRILQRKADYKLKTKEKEG
jgi:hypothetical protein